MEQNNQAAVIAVVEYEKAYSTKYLRIGDEVVMDMDKEARGWGRKGVADGTRGRVVGFFEYFTTHNLNRDKNTGIYRGNGAAVVQWEDGTASHEGNDICIPKLLLEQRRKDTVWNEAFEKSVKLYDLPKFDYMVGNKVVSRREFRGVIEHDSAVITNIDFDEIMNLRTGELLPAEKWANERIFHIDLEGGGSTRASITEIGDIIEKGNYWAWLNDKSQLVFKDLQDEATFYATLGKRTQLRSPRSGDYKWTVQDALEAMQHGDVDGLSKSLALFGAKQFPTVYKFDDDLTDLAERVRAETLKGFADFVPEDQPSKKYKVVFTVPIMGQTISVTKEIKNYIPPTTSENLVLEGMEFKVNHSYKIDDESDNPVSLTPAVLLVNDVSWQRGNGIEDRVDVPVPVRVEAARRIFNELTKNGWVGYNPRDLAKKKYEVFFKLATTEYSIRAIKEVEFTGYSMRDQFRRLIVDGETFTDQIIPMVHSDKTVDVVSLQSSLLTDMFSNVAVGTEPDLKIVHDFFNRLEAKGWTVDRSKFIAE